MNIHRLINIRFKEESHYKGMHAKDYKYLRAQYRQNWSPLFTSEKTGLSFLRAKGINIDMGGGGSVISSLLELLCLMNRMVVTWVYSVYKTF